MNRIFLRSLRWVVLGTAGVVVVVAFGLACAFVYLAPSIPTAENLHKVQMAVPLRVYSRTGALISQIGEERRIPVTFEEIPQGVWQAVLAAEDDRFFAHRGLDWKGVARAVYKAGTGGSVQGGSTISQQAARNVYLNLDKTVRRKLSEVFLTWRMESEFSKEQILALYLTKIYFGQRSYGIAAAAETYYGRRLDELTVGQAATLAGIIQSPSRQNPITSPRNAEARRAYVLRRMTEQGFIDRATAEAAAKEPVASRGFAPLIDVDAPYVSEMARQEVVKRFGEAAINAGYKVYTTVDDRLQTAANRAARLGLIEYDRRYGYRGHLGKEELPAAPTGDQLDGLLNKYRAVGPLIPAVVLNVAATTADVHVRGQGAARIGWEGLSWAAKALNSGTGPAPRTAADVVKRGDVVHVISDRRGAAQLAQVPRAQAALVAMDPADGAVVALVGGFDFYDNQYNRATLSRRSPGSSFKPFLYSAALENGFTPASLINDAPILTGGEGDEDWRPRNSSGTFSGLMRLRQALVLSKNMVSVRVIQELGVDRTIDYATRFGFDRKDMPRNNTLALGTLAAPPVQMATGYAVFANGGFKVDWYFIQRIEDSTGKVVYEAEPLLACAECELAMQPSPETQLPGASQLMLPAYEEQVPPEEPLESTAAVTMAVEDTQMLTAQPSRTLPLRGLEGIPESMREFAAVQGGVGYLPEKQLAPRVISPQNAWLMGDIMHDVTTRGTARRTQAMGRNDLAGKTGTTNDGRDNWFNGYTSNLVASVWVGRDDNQPLGVREEGSTTAVPIWMYFMREALKAVPPSRMPRPDGLVDVRISECTGARAGPFDTGTITETFMLNQLPREPRANDPVCTPEGEAGAGGATRAQPLF